MRALPRDTLMVPMKRLALVVLFVLGGCAHRAHVTGIKSNPTARVDAATFTHVANDVLVDVAVGIAGKNDDEEGPQILVRTQIPCRVGPVPPPDGFRMVYVTFNPTTLSTFTVKEGFITVHRCEEGILEFSGGWDVEGTIQTSLELPFQPPNPPIPVTHVEITRVTATQVEKNANLR
jgi:hypothetical protein